MAQDAGTPRIDAETFYDPGPDVVLRFYSRSANAPPGRGVGEAGFVHPRARLHGIPHFRRGLSNFATAPFELDGRHYSSVEHAFQGAKISLADPGIGARFALDSGHPLASAPGSDAQAAGRRIVNLSPAQLSQWDGVKQDVMQGAWEARF